MRWSDGSLRLLMLIMWIALVRCARDLREIYGVGSGRLILSRSLILVGSGWKLAEAIKYLRFWCHFTGILNTILWDVLDTKIFHSILSGTYRKIHLELIVWFVAPSPFVRHMIPLHKSIAWHFLSVFLRLLESHPQRPRRMSRDKFDMRNKRLTKCLEMWENFAGDNCFMAIVKWFV